eukprot:PhM_4_TR739/c0_g1_i1/m.100031/K08956/AFG3; AFG3 family protein
MGDYQRGYEDAAEHNRKASPSWIRNTFGPLVWIGIPLGISWYMMRRPVAAAGKAASGGGNLMDMMNPVSARNFRSDVKGTTFNNVIGIPEAKQEVQQYVEFLKKPEQFSRLGAHMPRGCLLTGDPGTGKTLLAKAVAGEAGVPFFSCNGADFIEVYGGSGPKRVRELFAEARKEMPCVIFVDEIDAIGSRNKRGGGGGGGGSMNSEENRTINQLLAELDGLGSSTADSIVVFAATNLKDNIDPALLREGRFDRKVDIEMPDRTARVELFEYYLDKIVLPSKDGMNELASKLADVTPGLSPATVAAIVNEAALTASVNGDAHVTYPVLVEAIEDVTIGKKLKRNRATPEAVLRTAYHECGHAMTAWFLPKSKQRQGDVIKVSLVPRGQALGYTQRKGGEVYEYDTDQKFFHEICVLLGGRVAEEIIYKEVISTGAVDDLQRATQVSLSSVLTFAFSGKAGRLSHGQDEVGKGRAFVKYSEKAQVEAEHVAKETLQRAHDAVRTMLEERRELLVKFAKQLVEKKELSAEEIEGILGPRVQ